MRFYLNGIATHNVSGYLPSTGKFPYWTIYFDEDTACEFIHERIVDSIRIEDEEVNDSGTVREGKMSNVLGVDRGDEGGGDS